ncbi:MAG: hypothetical protein HUK26_08825, partial [Duodenibacillus sp.]|nr:hypothetical protein [Duodenibacillus sp.]
SVDEALAMAECYDHPVNFIIADRAKAAVVEVLPGGRTVVRTTSDGTLAHTNHYIEPESAAANELAPGSSSEARLARIRELLAGGPFTFARFVAMTRDRAAGPDASIFRTGSSDKVQQTIATLVVRLPPAGEPRVRLTYRTDPKDAATETAVELDAGQIFGRGAPK